MLSGIARVVLRFVLVDCEAKADIIDNAKATPENCFLVYPGFLGGKPAVESAENISCDHNADTLVSRAVGNITHAKMECHTRGLGSGKGQSDRL